MDVLVTRKIEIYSGEKFTLISVRLVDIWNSTRTQTLRDPNNYITFHMCFPEKNLAKSTSYLIVEKSLVQIYSQIDTVGTKDSGKIRANA